MTLPQGFSFDGGCYSALTRKSRLTLKPTKVNCFTALMGTENALRRLPLPQKTWTLQQPPLTSVRTRIAKLDLTTASAEGVKQAVKSALVSFHEEHLFPRPEKSEPADFDLLVGLWLRGTTHLLASHYTVVNPVLDPYRAVELADTRREVLD